MLNEKISMSLNIIPDRLKRNCLLRFFSDDCSCVLFFFSSRYKLSSFAPTAVGGKIHSTV